MSPAPASFGANARRILALAWPIFVGQVAVLAFGTLDTVLLARFATTDLAAFAVGASAYIIVFIGLMGVVGAIAPIAGRLYGAGQHAQAGRQLWQALWLAGGLALAGGALLLFPQPFLSLSRAEPVVAAKVGGYLAWLAAALPAALAFTAFRGFSNAVSRPRLVMVLQLAALGLKLPLALALVGGVPALGIPALGVTGCGISTAVTFWAQALLALAWLRRDRFYDRFALTAPGQWRPHGAALKAQLKLGLPMGAGIAVEVTGFAAMALFIARLGPTAVAGHQIVANLVSLLFMLPLALSHGTATLVAQRIGAQALADARRIGAHGLLLATGLALAVGSALYLGRQGVVALYTDQAAVAGAALPLLAWVLAFHVADAVQTVTAFVLRAWHVATLPMVVYLLAIWGVGLGGGNLLAFSGAAWVPVHWQGARGFWVASTCGLGLAALALAALQWRLTRAAASTAALRPPAAAAG